MAATAAEVRAECNLTAKVADGALNPHLIKGERKVRELLGVEAYEAIQAETSPYTAEDLALVTSAEALFAGAFALPFLGIRTSGAGIVRSTGQGDSRESLASTEDLLALGDVWKEQAVELIRGLIPAPDETESPEYGLTVGGIRWTSAGGAE